jgi:F-type H+-transporting ATPase subunit a
MNFPVPFFFAAAEGGHAHELPLHAVEIFRIGWFTFTNSSLFSLIVAALVILFAQIATRNMSLIPGKLQSIWEVLIEGLYGLLEGILGRHLLNKTFWFFATIFIFILSSNWFGLIPGVGTVGYGHTTESGHFMVTEPFIRGVNADLNMTAAMALMFFALWIFWSIQANGPVGFVKHIFFPGTGMKGFAALGLGLVFFAVGLIEVISILFRPVSLSFRLFGNIYGGEYMLENMFVLNPSLSWLIPIPFYFLELLVGIVQALVFCLLTAVFTALMCRHDDNHGEKHAAH